MQYIISMPNGRPKSKTSTVTLRVTPALKAAAEKAATLDHRTLTGFIEVLIIKHCADQKIPVDSQAEEVRS